MNFLYCRLLRAGYSRKIKIDKEILRTVPAVSWNQPDYTKTKISQQIQAGCYIRNVDYSNYLCRSLEDYDESSMKYKSYAMTEEKKVTSPIHRLNNDCLMKIFSHLSHKDKLTVEKVNIFCETPKNQRILFSGIKALAKLSNIKDITVRGGVFDNELAILFQKNRKLRKIKLVYGHKNSDGNCILHLPTDSIEELVIKSPPSSMREKLRMILERSKNLNSLKIQDLHISFESGAIIRAIVSCSKSLEVLEISHDLNRVQTYHGIPLQLESFAQLMNLKSINLEGNPLVTDEFIKTLTKACKKLVKVNISVLNKSSILLPALAQNSTKEMQNKWQELISVGILVLFVDNVLSSHRKLDFAYNEDCHEPCNQTARLGHVIAAGPNDTIHYIWDFTGNPTILIAVTSPSAKLKIDWKKFLSQTANSVNFTEKPSYSFGVTVERILEFDDVNDHARIDQVAEDHINELKFEHFQWHHKNFSKNGDLVELSVEASNYNDPRTSEERNGTIKFLMHGFGSPHHSDVMPRLLHTENATQIDIIIDHLDTKKDFPQSRFAVELLIVSENNPNMTMVLGTQKKLDDEFTPGIFEIMELTIPQLLGKSAYMEWKPVSYTAPDRDVTDSTGSTIYSMKNATVDEYLSKNNLLYSYYGDKMYDYLVQRVNVSFGTSGDGFYEKSMYNTWTFVAGYGLPSDERFSYTILLFIFACVSTPMLIFVIAGVYMCFRQIPESDERLIR
ncbi:hypothetical protein QAD02_000991 [Eretmocerus hayati]|uniref:Uncharacterized protein n=1 Tax=Eretmocerus hayati TaxID=131215 RepID=A0ACC2NHK7_9HYME|nr:hypothetical protein QAD02_000991 [Eretmocerus hayati]